MATIFRWLLRLFLALVVLVAVAVGLIYWLASRSLPNYSATLSVAGITQPVEIVRDHADVPHIFGKTDADVFFGLGFVHAQDRLWQMTLMRRTVQGRLSELFGKRTVHIDALLRRLDLYGLAIKSVAAQDTYTKAALKAYSAGVNAWIGEVNKGSLGRGAPEFFLFSNEIAPWTPADSLAIINLLGLQLTDQLAAEVLRARLSLILPAARVRDILPDAPGAAIAALPRFASLFPDVPRYTSTRSRPHDPLDPVPGPGLAGASNAWAAAPSRTAQGSTLLANDPHLNFTAPTIWYLAHLGLASGGVIGGTIPGIPVVLVGRSDKLGWGLTTSYADDQDVHIEKLNPANHDEYLTPTGYKPFITRKSVINVKGAAPITLTLHWSENGPILSGDEYNLKAVTPPGYVASLSWTLLTPKNTSMSAAMKLMRAGSVKQAIAAAQGFIAPSQNLTLADRKHIALKTIGRVPRRDPANQTQGRMPSPGWLRVNRWQGMLPYASNPVFLNPAGGIVGNTNNKITDRPFPLNLSFTWGDTQRIERWRKLMQSRRVHSRQSFIETQLDTVSYTARSLLPLIGRNLWFTGEQAPKGTRARMRQRALAMLGKWNGDMNEDLPEPLIYEAWIRKLQDLLIRDDLGPLADRITHVKPVFIERVYRNIDGAATWCDIKQSSVRETCTDIARIALDDALLSLSERYGRNLTSWRWGDAHQALHDHTALGKIPVLRWFVNIHQSTSGGDNTLNRGQTSGRPPNPYANVHGAGYRGVYDFADPDSSVFITATGQSGHFLSRHYDDLGQLWRRGRYVSMSLDPALARAAAVGITHLVPWKK